MSDLTIYPADIAEMSLANWRHCPPAKAVSRNLDQALDWLKRARSRTTRRWRAPANASRTGAPRSARTSGVHLHDGALHVAADTPKRVSWDQAVLGEIARRIAASGERVEDYIDIEFSIPESRFNALPPAWRDQFAPARTVKPGKQNFKLSFDGGEA
ncbi:MAG: hypothetical protein R3E42_14505 [Burkholderiaceae bacterium]